MLARLGKYETKSIFLFFIFPSTCIRSTLLRNLCLMLWSGFCRTGDISWLIDKGSQWLPVWRCQGEAKPKSTLIWTLMVLRQWAATLAWTRARRGWAEHGWTHSLCGCQRLVFSLEGHFNGTKYWMFLAQTAVLAGVQRPTMMQYWITPCAAGGSHILLGPQNRLWCFVQTALDKGVYNLGCTVTNV